MSYLCLWPLLPFVVKSDSLEPFTYSHYALHDIRGLKQCSGDVTVKVSQCKRGIRSGVDDGHGSWKWRHLCRVMKQQQHYTMPHCRLIEAVRAAGTQPVL